MAGKILVVGSTGRVGSELVSLLLRKGETAVAATRNPTQHASSPLSQMVRFDFDDPATFAPALEGIDRLFLMARPGDNHSDKAAMPLIDEAKRQRVSLIVNLTAMGVEQDETFMLRVLEKYVESSGIPFVHLRPNWFMQNFDSGPIFADIRATRAIHLPAADARLSFIDVRDIAAAACEALTDRSHRGNAYTLTGAEALSHFDIAQELTEASGTTVTYVPIAEDAARAGLEARGVPSGYISRWADFFSKVRKGYCEPISPDVERILNRPPISFTQYAKDFALSWK